MRSSRPKINTLRAWASSGDSSIVVRGTSYWQINIIEARDSEEFLDFVLTPEPLNPHHKKAVRVSVLYQNLSVKQVGYLPREVADEYYEHLVNLLARDKTVVITEGYFVGGSSVGRLTGVRLEIDESPYTSLRIRKTK